MNKIDPRRAVLFVAVFGFIAILISVLNHRLQPVMEQQTIRQHIPQSSVRRPDAPPPSSRPAQNFEAEERARAQIAALEETERIRRAKAEAEADHARYLARYLNPNFTRKPGAKTVALVAVSENGKFNRTVSDAVADRLKGDTVQIVASFFKPEFVSDGLFNSAFAEPNEIIKKLELAKSLDVVLLARQTVRYSTTASLENVTTASMELELTAFPTDASSEPSTWTFRAPGPGFKNEDARAMAEERVIKQITRDTNMSLNAMFTNN